MQREFFCKLNPRNDSGHLEKFYAEQSLATLVHAINSLFAPEFCGYAVHHSPLEGIRHAAKPRPIRDQRPGN